MNTDTIPICDRCEQPIADHLAWLTSSGNMREGPVGSFGGVVFSGLFCPDTQHDPCFPRLTEKEINYDQDEA